MDLAEYYKKADPVLGVAKVLFSRLFDQFESKEISQIADSSSGGTPNRGNSQYFNGTVPWLKSGELNDSLIETCEEFITEEGLKNSSAKLFPKGTLLVAMYGATAGKTGVLGFDSTTNQAICAVFPQPELLQEFLYWFLRQHRIDFIIQSKGGAQPNISQRVINATKIPMPPLNAQRAIVDFLEKVNSDLLIDQDFPFLDELGKKQINEFFEIRNTHTTLNQKFQSQKSLLSQLKQSILQEAIQGKLTAEWRVLRQAQQLPIEPASELLKRIQTEKARLINPSTPLRAGEKRIKKEKPLPPISEEEKPFELPEGWEWCRLGEICNNVTAGSTPSKESFFSDEIPYLKVYNIRNQKIDFAYKPQFIKTKIHQGALSRYILKPGYVIMNIVGPPLGKVAIIPNSYPEWNCNQAIAIFNCLEMEVNPFIYKYLSSGIYLKFLNFKGMAGQDNISVTQCKNLVFPVPPLEEQKAIVEKVELLMAKCAALETEINQSEQ